jgi:hydroxymethylpyrimidine/phosphomethylpyrimidine kinase
MSPPPVVLSIAGFDPSSGAGVTADVKTIAAHRCYGTTCITALTVQSTRGVKRVFTPPAELIRATLEELWADLPPDAVRIGMLGSGELAETLASHLERFPAANVVLDPLLRSSSGASLVDDAGLQVLRRRLLARADIVTPNLDEAAALTGVRAGSLEEMKAAAIRLHELGAKAVVVKGGHLEGNCAIDLLSVWDGTGPRQREFSSPRLKVKSTHGTGCAFATALACNLALKFELPEAVARAKRFVSEAMKTAHDLGSGPGPMNLSNFEF